MLKEFMERGRRLCGRWCLIGRGEQVGRALDLHIGVVLHDLGQGRHVRGTGEERHAAGQREHAAVERFEAELLDIAAVEGVTARNDVHSHTVAARPGPCRMQWREGCDLGSDRAAGSRHCHRPGPNERDAGSEMADRRTGAEPGLAWDERGALRNRAGLGAILVMHPGQPTVRRLASVPKGSGRVSGLAFDAHGGIWTALCEGWSIARFSPDGQLDRIVGLPVPCATDLAVSGAAGGGTHETLMVTSARQSVPIDALTSAPLSGRLFSVRI